MKLKGIIDYDCVNYKDACMTLMFPYCSFKCDRENGCNVCQNSSLAEEKTLDISMEYIVKIFNDNPLTHAICFQGLEPLDSWDELKDFITLFRSQSTAPIVIYTNYNKEKIENKIEWLKEQKPMKIKYGRFVPNQQPHYDAVLGVNLASDNQYAEEL